MSLPWRSDARLCRDFTTPRTNQMQQRRCEGSAATQGRAVAYLVARVDPPQAGLDALIGEQWLVTRGLPILFLESVSGCEQPLLLRSRRMQSLGWSLEQRPGWVVGQDDVRP